MAQSTSSPIVTDTAPDRPELWTPVVADLRPARPTPDHPALQPIVRAEAANEASDFRGALELLDDAYELTRTSPGLRLRALLAESWARMYLGELAVSDELLQAASDLVGRPEFQESDRAEVLYRLGCCRLQRGKVGNATELFTISLELCHRSEVDCSRLRARVLQWRARCWLRQHLPEMARLDAELAVELAAGLEEPRTVAHAHLQASVVAERQSNWLMARLYAERALEGYERIDDAPNTQIVLNNLGGINFLLDNHERATSYLTRALDLAQELGDETGAGYTVATLAQMALRRGDPIAAEAHALRAVDLLDGADAHLGEMGGALLTLGRATLEQGRFNEAEHLFRRADRCFEQISSVGHRAEAWVAQGDLARERGDLVGAADRYRKAALALQDIHL